MDKDAIIEALKSHNEAIQTVSGLLLATAIPMVIQLFRDDEKIKILNYEFNKENLFQVAVLVYLILNLVLLLYFERVRELLTMVSVEDFGRAALIFTLDGWPLNVFAHYGSGILSILQSAFGYCLIMAIWVLFGASIIKLARERSKRTFFAVFPLALFPAGAIIMADIVYSDLAEGLLESIQSAGPHAVTPSYAQSLSDNESVGSLHFFTTLIVFVGTAAFAVPKALRSATANKSLDAKT